MKYLKEEDKAKKPFPFGVILICAVLVVAAFAGGFWVSTALVPQTEVPTTPVETAAPSVETTEPATEAVEPETLSEEPTEPIEVETVPANTIEVFRVEGEDIVVPTPYGDIYYGAKFEEFLTITHQISQELYAVRFQVDIGVGETIDLFDVYFAKDDGRQPEGEVLGGMMSPEGEPVLVIVATNLNLPDPEWDADTANLVYAMLEGVSDSMERLSRAENMILDQ